MLIVRKLNAEIKIFTWEVRKEKGKPRIG